MPMDVAAQQLLEHVRPLLGNRDEVALAAVLRRQWPPDKLCGLLGSADTAVVRTAAACLGFSGQMEHAAALTALLKHPQEGVAESAEKALWHLWMEAGTPAGNHQLAAAIGLIREDDLQGALAELADVIADEPDFAEAHHQKGLVLLLLERFDEAQRSLKRAIELNPLHFSAILNLGHVHANRGDVFAAAREYRRALAINPRIPDIAEVLAEIDAVGRVRAIA